jgi:Raf kinase inhibitor-like YbhB/YbcL family protein
MMFELSSPAFTDGAVIPKKHTCDGADVSPALRWANPPKATRCFTLIVDDPDAPMGTWVHWVLYNLPADLRELPEAVPPDDSFPNGMHQGINDFKRIGYGGPCPPPGKPHRYFFTLYAVNAMLNLKPRATKGQVLEASQGHIQAETKLMGRYGR